MDADEQRTRIEAELGEEGRRWLDWWCEARWIPRKKWPHFPTVCQEVEQAACMRLAERIQIEAGGKMRWRKALNDAAVKLRLNPDAIMRRHDRDVSRRFPSERAA